MKWDSDGTLDGGTKFVDLPEGTQTTAGGAAKFEFVDGPPRTGALDWYLAAPPKPNAQLQFAEGANVVVFNLTCPYPNAWWRFMQWACFGFRWTRLGE